MSEPKDMWLTIIRALKVKDTYVIANLSTDFGNNSFFSGYTVQKPIMGTKMMLVFLLKEKYSSKWDGVFLNMPYTPFLAKYL